MLSRDGQQAIARGFMVPVRADVESPRGIPSADQVLRQSLPIDWVYLAGNQDRIKYEWRTIMQ
jgi:iron(III) transport system substrate-binding protein